MLACKGASDRIGRVEIWTKPKPIDPNKRGTKAAKWGVAVHMIGQAKAKDLVLGWAQEGGRVRLEGTGPGRMHWYEGVRPDWYEQLLSEMKIPSPSNPRIRQWTPRTDRRNEALDCTIGCVWLCRYLQLHLRKPGQWAAWESRLLQASLLDDPADDAEHDAEDDDQAPPPSDPASSPAVNPPAAPSAPAGAQPVPAARTDMDESPAAAVLVAAPAPAGPKPKAEQPVSYLARINKLRHSARR